MLPVLLSVTLKRHKKSQVCDVEYAGNMYMGTRRVQEVREVTTWLGYRSIVFVRNFV